MNAIRSTWAFKLKRYPDRLINKFKAHGCAQHDMQLEGINFFKTYAPVVHWTTVRLMLILEVLLGSISNQGNVTTAFLHANLGKDKKIFVDMPWGFEVKGKNGRNKVLKWKKICLGCFKAPETFESTWNPRCNYVASYSPKCIRVSSLVRKW